MKPQVGWVWGRGVKPAFVSSPDPLLRRFVLIDTRLDSKPDLFD
jgi:hypothetical protein